MTEPPPRKAPVLPLAVIGAALCLATALSYQRCDRSTEHHSVADAPASQSGERSDEPKREAEVAPTSSNALRPNSPAPSSRAVQGTEAEALLDETSITERLRGLGQTEPERTLELAREGNERFPDGPDAAERNWYLVRALVNLKRFSEAKERAEWMVDHFGDNHFALDVRQHLLVHPLGRPSREELERQNGH